MTLVSMLCTPFATNCDCHYSITGETGSSWAWQEFGIFEAADPAAPVVRRQRFLQPIPDGTCQINKRSHEDDNDASISQPKPTKRAKESHNDNTNTTLSTVSLSEEENKCSSSAIVVGQRGGGSPTCILRGGGTEDQPMQGTQTNNIPINQQISSFLIKEAGPLGLEEEHVCPHPPTNDVLSRIASTPFDADRMKACYKQNRDGINSTTTRQSAIITPLPIIPQNEFIKGTSQRTLIATINRDVSAFLLSEAANIPIEEQEEAPSQSNANSTNYSLSANNSASIPIQSLNTNNTYDISLADVSIANFGMMHDGTVVFLCYNEGVEVTNQRMQSGDVIVAINGRDTTGLPGKAVLEMLQSSVAFYWQLTLVERTWYDTQNAPKTEADAQKNYDEAYKLSMRLQQIKHNLSRKPPDYETLTKLNVSKHHFEVAEKLREATWWKLRSWQRGTQETAKKLPKATETKKATVAKKKKDYPSAIASDIIKISHADLSKLPVAFGFRLGDKSSRSAATAAMTKWRVEGKRASNSIFIGKNTPSSKGSTPESRHNTANSTTPRSSAILLSNESMSSNYPGWTKRRFERASGSSAGSKDTYFYSPHLQIKFRAMKGVDAFIRIMAEPDVDGDESKAIALYKQRGYKT